MFQLFVVFDNKITAYEHLHQCFSVSNSDNQPAGWRLLIVIVPLLCVRVMCGCTTGLCVCSHRHLISELQGRFPLCQSVFFPRRRRAT